jgi:hypothetical protein
LVALEMTSTLRRLAAAVALAAAAAALSPVALPAAQARAAPKAQLGYTREAQRVLAAARAASGGAAWNLLRGWHETGHQGAQPYEAWFDTLRYGMRIETRDAAGAVSAEGFNGQGFWRIASTGQSSGVDDRAEVARARTAAFLGASGYFYTGRFDAHGELAGVRRAHGHAYDVVRVQPWDGAPCELWFDRASHLLARIVDRSGPQPVTTELSDYRAVGPIRVAFHVTVQGPGPAAVLDRHLDAVVFSAPDRALFSLPRTDGQ